MTTTAARKNPYFNLVEKNSKGFLKLSKVFKRKIYTRQDAPKVLEHVASMYALKPNFIIKKKISWTEICQTLMLVFYLH